MQSPKIIPNIRALTVWPPSLISPIQAQPQKTSIPVPRNSPTNTCINLNINCSLAFSSFSLNNEPYSKKQVLPFSWNKSGKLKPPNPADVLTIKKNKIYTYT